MEHDWHAPGVDDSSPTWRPHHKHFSRIVVWFASITSPEADSAPGAAHRRTAAVQAHGPQPSVSTMLGSDGAGFGGGAVGISPRRYSMIFQAIVGGTQNGRTTPQ
jgi:hypothetical protein